MSVHAEKKRFIALKIEWFYPVRHAVFFAHHARDRRSVMSDATEEGAAHHRPGRKRVAFFQFCDPFAAGSFDVGIGTNEVECDLERCLFIFHPCSVFRPCDP